MIFVYGRELFRLYEYLKIKFMTSSKFLKTRKMIARLLVVMLYDGRYFARNLGWIYRNYAGPLLGVSFETFSSYLDYDGDPLDDDDLPRYLIVGLWLLVNVPRTTGALPADLLRRMSRMRHVKAGYARRRASAVPEWDEIGSADGEPADAVEEPAEVYFAEETV